MTRRLGALFALAVGLAACGGGSKHSTATHPATTPTAASSPLAPYLLRNGDGGFEVFGTPIDQPTVAEWVKVSSSTSADGQRVRGEGFVDALEQDTATTTGGSGLDFVLELGSPAAARREQAVQLAEDIAAQGRVRVTRFSVPGIPGSVGIAAFGGRQGSAANALFTEGRCVLLVGDGEAGANYKSQVISGAQAIYQRGTASSGPCGAADQLKL